MSEPTPMTGAAPRPGDEATPLTEQLARVEEENRALTAQMTHALRLGEELLEEARLEADSLVSDAHEQAAKLMLEAEDEVDRLVGQARREASTAVAAEQARIDRLAAEVEARERHATALLEQTREERRAMEEERTRLAAELRDLVARFMDVATPIAAVSASTADGDEDPLVAPVEAAAIVAPPRVEPDDAAAPHDEVAVAEAPGPVATETPTAQPVDGMVASVVRPIGWEPIDASELIVTGFFSPDAEPEHGAVPDSRPPGPETVVTEPEVSVESSAATRDLFERPADRPARAEPAAGQETSLADRRLFDSPTRGDDEGGESVRPVPETLAEWGLGPDAEVDDHAFDAFFSSDVEDEPSRSWMLDVER